MDVEKMFESRFIKAADLDGREWTLTIVGVRLEALHDRRRAGERVKGIVTFARARKEWVLNRTNATCLVAMWGRDTDAWTGKSVTLYPAPFEGEARGELAIRVRGSPDLAQPLDVVVALPRKRPFTMRMEVTARPRQARTPPRPQRARNEPARDTERKVLP